MSSVGLAEIVLIVGDAERSVRFYREAVGLTPETPAEDGWAWFCAGEPGQKQRVALREDPLLFEEHSPRASAGAGSTTPSTCPARVCTRPSEASDVEVYGPTRFDRMDATSYYFYDPDGNVYELTRGDART